MNSREQKAERAWSFPFRIATSVARALQRMSCFPLTRRRSQGS
jgi:hypothetical protein